MTRRFSKATLLAGSVMAGAAFAAPAYAQAQVDEDPNEPALQAAPDADEAEFGEPIVVTGSRIQRRNVDTAAPIAVVNDEEFQLSGTVNVENVINTLPQVIPGTTSFSNNPGDGSATLNLRGLGVTRNLVLVNGRRWMFYDTSQVVDLNTIPSFLIDSVDVVTGGASAIYGSDAIAGVTNFRLRDVEGVELGGQYSLTERGDGAAYNIHGAIGTSFGDGRGNATVFADYFNRQDVFQGDRAFSRFAVGNEATFGDPLGRGGSSTVPQGRFNTPGTVVVEPAFDANGDGDTNDPGEAAVSAPIASGLIFDDAFFENPLQPRARTGADLYNYAPVNYLQIPQERYLLGGYADYDVGGGHTVYTEVTYVNNRVATELAATPVTGTFNIDIDTVSPFLSDAAIAELREIDANETAAILARQEYNDSLGYCDPGEVAPDGARPCIGDLFTGANTPAAQEGVISTFVQRRVTETGSRNSLDERNAFRVLGGVRGPITDTLQYDAHYFFARTRNSNIQRGNISRSAFQAGLDGSGTPINIFGPNTLTPAQVDAISILAQNSDVSSLQVVNGSISGTLGDFAIGEAEPVGFAVGTEYRKVASQFIPDTALASGDVIGFNAGQPTEGSYDVREVFAELSVPIEFGSARLELTGAGRYSDYSLENVGGVWTYAAGVEFAPIPDVLLRGQYQRAVRAPNVDELFGGQAIGFPGAVDPCTTDAAGEPGALRDLCIANGVDPSLVGTSFFDDPQIPATFGGNPNLQEETSTSYTFGVVLQPRFLPGFTLTADYYNIEVEDAIITIGLQQSFDLCFNQVQDQNDPVCDPFFAGGPIRESSRITVANPPNLGGQNIATLTVSGIDLEASYDTTIPFSLFTDTGEQGLNLSFLGTWTEESSTLPFAGADLVDCAGLFGLTCGEPTPEFKWTSRASFIDGPFTTSVRWRHLGSVTDDSLVLDPENGVDFEALGGVNEIDSYDLIDLTFSFEASEQFAVTFGVNNLFDTLPDAPVFGPDGTVIGRGNSLLLGDNQEQANTYPSTYDVLGRRYFVSAAFKF